MGKNGSRRLPRGLGANSWFRNEYQLYLMILPAVIYFFVFNYMPMYGIQIAFRDYKAVFGITGSK